MRSERRNLADRLRPARRWVGRVESAEVRLLGRSVLSLLFRERVLVLDTVGRRTGAPRRTTLAYREVDGELVVVGGAGGQTRTPDWVANVRAAPAVHVTRDRRRTPMTARILEGEERSAMWARLLPQWPRIAIYEDRAGHPIPVVRLTPRQPGPPR